MSKISKPKSSLPQRLKSFWSNSQTKGWAYIQLAGSGVLASVGQINKAITDPSVKELLDKIDLPTSIVIGLAFFGVVSYLAHGHDD